MSERESEDCIHIIAFFIQEIGILYIIPDRNQR